ncbi:hypothetical protein GW17_00011050 [Ensete ventricosum]|nr:hypothetical protein GW17_00011050 [Ensete ventricosum]RZS28884.1 hypothetical protein BHM03_00062534 [Ensete ventricosum]
MPGKRKAKRKVTVRGERLHIPDSAHNRAAARVPHPQVVCSLPSTQVRGRGAVHRIPHRQRIRSDRVRCVRITRHPHRQPCFVSELGPHNCVVDADVTDSIWVQCSVLNERIGFNERNQRFPTVLGFTYVSVKRMLAVAELTLMMRGGGGGGLTRSWSLITAVGCITTVGLSAAQVSS